KLLPETAFSIMRLANTASARKLPDTILSEIGDVKPFIPDIHRKHMAPNFFALFWMMELYDVHVPADQYEQGVKAIQQMAEDQSASAKRRDRYVNIARRLEQEHGRHKEHVQKVEEFFKTHKDTLLDSVAEESSAQHFTKAFI